MLTLGAPFLLVASASGPGAVNPWLGLALGMLLVALNGFFVAAEFALVKVRPTQLETLASRGSRRAKLGRHMLKHLDAYISATQLGITMTSLGLGWVGEPAFAWILEPLIGHLPGVTPELLHSISLAFAFAAITILHIVLGELAPKALAIRMPDSTTLWTALPLHFFYKLTFPLIWLLNGTANGILKLVGIQPMSESEHAHSEEELRQLLAGAASANLSLSKRQLLGNVFELHSRIARQVMVPRGDVVYLTTERSLEDNLRLARQAGHTRFPLCQGDLDHVIGMIHIKDLFRREAPITDLESLARKIPLVPETITLDRLLRRMRTEKMHLAAVLDEYGGVSGIVTLENVIEEIVGQIQDEFDTERPEIVQKGENVYLVSGQMLVADLEAELDLELSDRDEDTLGGIVLSELGRRPNEGDRGEVGPVAFEVVEVEGNRVKTLRITVRREAEGEEE